MIRIGVLCPAEIAFRRFMPALKIHTEFKFIGIAVCSPNERFGHYECNKDEISIINVEKNKAKKFIEQYGGHLFDSYEELITSNLIDAIYIPLPPALHYKWSKLAIENNKHVLVEKPSTTNYEDTSNLIELSRINDVALHENYMFIFHDQINKIYNLSNSELGELRLIRIDFGFPLRSASDFRYNKNLGGGAFIDAAGYCIKYASYLLGDTAKIVQANLGYKKEYSVDFYGSGTMVNLKGDVVQFSFGMDNEYKCDLEIWGSKGKLTSKRILTAPLGFIPTVEIVCAGQVEIKYLESDDTFFKSIDYFHKCISDKSVRENSYNSIDKQAKLCKEYIELEENEK